LWQSHLQSMWKKDDSALFEFEISKAMIELYCPKAKEINFISGPGDQVEDNKKKADKK
jgi:hypothetical protein